MADILRDLVALTNGGLAFAETGAAPDLKYSVQINPANLAAVTTLGEDDYVLVNDSGTAKEITIPNFRTVLGFALANITNWNTAYGWGNHASGGYLTNLLHDTTDRHTLGTVVPHDTLNGLTDVTITTPADNDVLAYDTASATWINQTAAAAGLATASHVHTGVYEPVISAGTTAQYWRGDKSWQTLNTAAVAEHASYLYYTDARARAALSSTATGLTYTSGTGVFSLTASYVIPTTTQETNWTGAYTLKTTLDGLTGFLKGAVGSYSQVADPLPMANGGTSKALTANNGGIVWTDADSMEVLPGTATAGQMLRSGASVTPTWSTAVWPATVAANNLLYASSANVVVALPPTATGILTTTGSVPTWMAAPLTAPYGGTGLTAYGAANRVLGMNSGATALEYKDVLGTSNQITVTHGANSITLSAAQNIHLTATPQFARMGLGTSAGTAVLYTLNGTQSSNDPAGLCIGFLAARTIVLTAGNTQGTVGVMGDAYYNQGAFNATSTSAARGLNGRATATGASGTVTTIIGVQGQVQNTAAGVVTNAKALEALVAVNSGGGTIDNAYGLYINSQSAGTNKWQIYCVGLQDCYTGGLWDMLSLKIAGTTRIDQYGVLTALYGSVQCGSASGTTAMLGGSYYNYLTTVGNAADTADAILASRTLEANLLANNGSYIEIVAMGVFAANANAKQLRLWFGSTACANTSSTHNNKHWSIRAWIFRVTSTTQRAIAILDIDGVAPIVTYSTPAETLSGTVLVKVTGNTPTSTANDVQSHGFNIRYYRVGTLG